ncbi:MAG TPA: LysR substrate-binding domain-containing protein, partial [Burkholderiaceae bacterium]|nr:LysR substrate-binding domain-containing protein [Burkholderiaceae bacterium]
ALVGALSTARARAFIGRRRADRGASPKPLLPEPVQEVSYFTTAFGLVAAGLGVTMCPSYARPLVQAYGLQMLPLQDPGFYREVCTFSLADKSLSPAAASLLDCLDEAVTELRFAEPVRRAK